MEKLIESFKMKCRQLHHAISAGDDVLVSILDRDIEPLIDQIVQSRAASSKDLRAQLQLVCDLIRDDAGDKNRVLRNTAILTVLLNRYFSDDASAMGRHLVCADRLAGSPSDDEGNLAGHHQAMLDQLADNIFVVTADYRIAYANIAAARTHKTTQLALLGRLISECCGTRRFRLDYMPAIAQCLHDPEYRAKLNYIGGADGCEPVSVVINGVRSLEGPVTSVMISERTG